MFSVIKHRCATPSCNTTAPTSALASIEHDLFTRSRLISSQSFLYRVNFWLNSSSAVWYEPSGTSSCWTVVRPLIRITSSLGVKSTFSTLNDNESSFLVGLSDGLFFTLRMVFSRTSSSFPIRLYKVQRSSLSCATSETDPLLSFSKEE
ncbi:hypothetical protein OGAPHI_001627 [Ogataea philodendri]|uniref:Uncharacterized protein n=1 Tax=Ogataea philodendri TaxID=1378263 RepID=A0A9P8PCY1_9ASCO|nr:uncharacterized protein OGAPHI_001627 [Ogataea philodendri]KAH3669506.1 hypothetical protein OGAPHI_001627 [Ogataea philodendri]